MVTLSVEWYDYKKVAHERIACGCFVFLWGIVVLRGMPEDSIYAVVEVVGKCCELCRK